MPDLPASSRMCCCFLSIVSIVTLSVEKAAANVYSRVQIGCITSVLRAETGRTIQTCRRLLDLGFEQSSQKATSGRLKRPSGLIPYFPASVCHKLCARHCC